MHDLDILAAAQKDFENHFGKSESISTSYDVFGGESVIIVEDHSKKAVYSLKAELIKVTNLKGEP